VCVCWLARGTFVDAASGAMFLVPFDSLYSGKVEPTGARRSNHLGVRTGRFIRSTHRHAGPTFGLVRGGM
jgi:hypothetical protein